MSPLNQKVAPKPGVTRAAKAHIRSALLGVTGALSARPEPRDTWDDLGRSDAIGRNHWVDRDVSLARVALGHATREGLDVQLATVQNVKRFFAVKLAETLDGFDVTGVSGLSTKLNEVAHAGSDVVVAAADVQHERSEGNLEAVRFAAMATIRSCEDVLDTTSAELARVHRPLEIARM